MPLISLCLLKLTNACLKKWLPGSLTCLKQKNIRSVRVSTTYHATLSKNSKKSVQFKLKCWQQMSRWTNSTFNVYPLLKPCLNNFYSKLEGKTKPEQWVYTNMAVCADFHWAKHQIKQSNSFHILMWCFWGKLDADHTFYCDALSEGMGFWDTDGNLDFYTPTFPLDEVPEDLIFHFKALCMLLALSHIHKNADNSSCCIVIYTNSSNTFDIFNLLQCWPAYNHIIKSTVDILIDGSHNLRVLHVPGVDNSVANALLHFDFVRAEELSPGLIIWPFQL